MSQNDRCLFFYRKQDLILLPLHFLLYPHKTIHCFLLILTTKNDEQSAARNRSFERFVERCLVASRESRNQSGDCSSASCQFVVYDAGSE